MDVAENGLFTLLNCTHLRLPVPRRVCRMMIKQTLLDCYARIVLAMVVNYSTILLYLISYWNYVGPDKTILICLSRLVGAKKDKNLTNMVRDLMRFSAFEKNPQQIRFVRNTRTFWISESLWCEPARRKGVSKNIRQLYCSTKLYTYSF